MTASMKTDFEQLYQQRLERYVTAMRNGMPDRIPIRPFAAEITAKYAGYTCQEVTHDYGKAFDAIIKCCQGFDWDATVANMVYVWTGLTQAIGLRYYGVPGIDIGPDVAFQYREPSEQNALMRAKSTTNLSRTRRGSCTKRGFQGPRPTSAPRARPPVIATTSHS